MPLARPRLSMQYLAGLRYLVASALLASAAPLAAQHAMQTIASGCAAVDAEREAQFALLAAVPAGHTVVVAVSTGAAATSGLQVHDSGGGSFAPVGARRVRSGGPSTTLLVRGLTHALAAGGALRIRFDTATDGSEVCLVAMAWADTVGAAAAVRASGSVAGESTTPSIALSQPLAVISQAVIGAVAFDPPATLAPNPGVAIAGHACTGSFCVALAHAQGDSAAASSATLGMSSAGTIRWQLTAATLARASVFRDGFEAAAP